MKTLKFVAPAMVLVAGLIMSSTTTQAKPEYSKKEKTGCVTCHVKAGSKDLNETGKFYKEKKTLEGAPKAAKK